MMQQKEKEQADLAQQINGIEIKNRAIIGMRVQMIALFMKPKKFYVKYTKNPFDFHPKMWYNKKGRESKKDQRRSDLYV